MEKVEDLRRRVQQRKGLLPTCVVIFAQHFLCPLRADQLTREEKARASAYASVAATATVPGFGRPRYATAAASHNAGYGMITHEASTSHYQSYGRTQYGSAPPARPHYRPTHQTNGNDAVASGGGGYHRSAGGAAVDYNNSAAQRPGSGYRRPINARRDDDPDYQR